MKKIKVKDVRFSRHIGDLRVLVQGGAAHSSFLSGCERMPSSVAVIPPSLSLCCCPVCLRSVGCSGPEKALGWPGLKAPMWVSSGSCPPLHHLDHSFKPCPDQPGLSRRSDQSLSDESLGKKTHSRDREPMGKQPAGQNGVKGVGK